MLTGAWDNKSLCFYVALERLEKQYRRFLINVAWIFGLKETEEQLASLVQSRPQIMTPISSGALTFQQQVSDRGPNLIASIDFQLLSALALAVCCFMKLSLCVSCMFYRQCKWIYLVLFLI
ncbi:uncharacterized protein LOC113665096 [Pocillopora damicornis]|uniref:uncharacterized protein LOC113665096 n=1 Tax=Pocillopora damicornis TaxID=46731 RepID=UPI000F556870|nr:uncharacterized protein LOC113665096 [Pocillopora damicornis]